MSEFTLAAGHLLTFLEGVGYILVAELLRKRPVSAEWRLPSSLFRSWWLLIGLNKLAASVMGYAWLTGWATDEAYFAALYVNILILCASLASLLSYFSFLLSGRHRYYVFVAMFYIGYYLLLTYHLASSHPSGVAAGEWRTYHIGNPPPPLRGLAVLAMLTLPQLIAAFAYLGLAFRIRNATTVYRVSLVAVSVIAWTLSILFVSLPSFDTNAAIQVASRFIGMAGAASAIAAYRPPQFVARLFRLAPLEEAVSPHAVHPS